MSDDATTQDGTTSEDGGSPEAATQETQSPTPDELVASYRKRQAGAEAARQVAEKRAAELERELAQYRTTAQTDAEKEAGELATLRERLAASEQRAAEAEAKAYAKILDAQYPNARKELPEVTDEVRLAKFEAMLVEEEFTAPTPQRHNESRSGEQVTRKEKEPTANDLKARLIAMPRPW
jgi:hypothetical protein